MESRNKKPEMDALRTIMFWSVMLLSALFVWQLARQDVVPGIIGWEQRPRQRQVVQ